MNRLPSVNDAGPGAGVLPPAPAPLSPGEVQFLWWFIQGSVMEPQTRRRLWRAWGMCARHAFAWLCAEASFRHGYLHGPAIVYAELMAQALRALSAPPPLAAARVARRLRDRGRCLMCELGYGPGSRGFISAARLAAGRDVAALGEFMARSERHWREDVCGVCAGCASAARCRIHLLREVAGGSLSGLAAHRVRLARMAARAARYSDSFRWERRGTDTAEDRAALVSAAGWCGGWSALLGVNRQTAR